MQTMQSVNLLIFLQILQSLAFVVSVILLVNALLF
jgi:hypothetical protein